MEVSESRRVAIHASYASTPAALLEPFDRAFFAAPPPVPNSGPMVQAKMSSAEDVQNMSASLSMLGDQLKLRRSSR